MGNLILQLRSMQQTFVLPSPSAKQHSFMLAKSAEPCASVQRRLCRTLRGFACIIHHARYAVVYASQMPTTEKRTYATLELKMLLKYQEVLFALSNLVRKPSAVSILGVKDLDDQMLYNSCSEMFILLILIFSADMFVDKAASQLPFKQIPFKTKNSSSLMSVTFTTRNQVKSNLPHSGFSSNQNTESHVSY